MTTQQEDKDGRPKSRTQCTHRRFAEKHAKERPGESVHKREGGTTNQSRDRQEQPGIGADHEPQRVGNDQANKANQPGLGNNRPGGQAGRKQSHGSGPLDVDTQARGGIVTQAHEIKARAEIN